MLSQIDFRKDHPFPHQAGVKHLYKFFKYNEDHPEYLATLFCEAKLYHSLPISLNDPFECRPHFKYPTKCGDAYKMRKYLNRLGKEQGLSTKKAKQMVSINMSRPEKLQSGLTESVLKAYNEIRICCFTKSNRNLLLWSHYANSHQGICVQFDASQLPLSATFKVKYQKEYPTIDFPQPKDIRALRPLLIKSRIWDYEEEYRSILDPEGSPIMRRSGASYLLRNDAIQAVYFGVNTPDQHQENIKSMIDNGPFSPKLWCRKLNKDEFSVDFHPLHKSV